MRRFSIDELPQLINVINGDMSLVGPRPALRPRSAATRPTSSAGSTCARPDRPLAGVRSSDLSWEDTVRLDLYYVDNWSIVQDLAILARTVHAVFASHGAY